MSTNIIKKDIIRMIKEFKKENTIYKYETNVNKIQRYRIYDL